MSQVIYRNSGWNLTMAFYLGLAGLGWIGAPCVVALYNLVEDPTLSGILIGVVTSLTMGVPFTRALRGRVWLEDGHLCSRNAFRTVRCPLGDISGVTTTALWQNFHVVAALETYSRGWGRPMKLTPVPAVDVEHLRRWVRA